MVQRIVTNFQGEDVAIDCMGCAFLQKKIIHPLGSIIETPYFEAHQDYEIPIPGFVILQSKRHVASIDALDQDEQKDFITTLVAIRKAMRNVLKIETVYVIQEEDSRHHFHQWLFPRYEWMTEQFGKKIESVRPIMEYARQHMKTEQTIAEIKHASEALKNALRS